MVRRGAAINSSTEHTHTPIHLHICKKIVDDDTWSVFGG